MRSCNYQNFSGLSRLSGALSLLMRFVTYMSCIRKAEKFDLKMRTRHSVLRADAVLSSLEGPIGLRRSSVWSCPTARRTIGMMIGPSSGFMLRLVFPVPRTLRRCHVLCPRRFSLWSTSARPTSGGQVLDIGSAWTPLQRRLT